MLLFKIKHMSFSLGQIIPQSALATGILPPGIAQPLIAAPAPGTLQAGSATAVQVQYALISYL